MTCPHCGYCSHCGRSGHWPYQTWPYQTQPYWCATSGNLSNMGSMTPGSVTFVSSDSEEGHECRRSSTAA